MRITEKGKGHFMTILGDILDETDNEQTKCLAIIGLCMLRDLNNVNLKILTTQEDRCESMADTADRECE
ncbi:MAG TPA: hypothetical protein DCZ71_04535 [Ruminococcus sp.]|nr:hypothetical protein [Ruminococcus sp.]